MWFDAISQHPFNGTFRTMITPRAHGILMSQASIIRVESLGIERVDDPGGEEGKKKVA